MARRWQFALCIPAGLVLIGLGGWGAVNNLDAADKVASVVGAFVGVAGLALSGYGLIQAQRGQTSGGQSVIDSTIHGGLLQACNVRGSLRIGPAEGTGSPIPTAAPSARPKPFPAASDPQPASPPPEPGGQTVTRSQITGPVYQVDGVGGDAEVDL